MLIAGARAFCRILNCGTQNKNTRLLTIVFIVNIII